jgi:hypothetical protein
MRVVVVVANTLALALLVEQAVVEQAVDLDQPQRRERMDLAVVEVVPQELVLQEAAARAS